MAVEGRCSIRDAKQLEKKAKTTGWKHLEEESVRFLLLNKCNSLDDFIQLAWLFYLTMHQWPAILM